MIMHVPNDFLVAIYSTTIIYALIAMNIFKNLPASYSYIYVLTNIQLHTSHYYLTIAIIMLHTNVSHI